VGRRVSHPRVGSTGIRHRSDDARGVHVSGHCVCLYVGIDAGVDVSVSIGVNIGTRHGPCLRDGVGSVCGVRSA
jgi:hypothetical protein